MKLGMPTLIELATLEQNAMLCNELELDFVEINMNLPNYQISKLKAKKLNALKDKYNIYFTFHLPEDLDIGHFNEKIRRAYTDSVLETIAFAKDIDAPIVNMHMNEGVHFKLPTKKVYLYEKFYADYSKAIDDFAGEARALLQGTDIKIMIENTGIYDRAYIINAIDIMLKNKHFALTFDIGHNQVSDNKDINYITKNIDKVEHMHIHDATYDKCHLALYDGDIDIDKYIQMAKSKDISAVIETKSVKALKKSIDTLKI